MIITINEFKENLHIGYKVMPLKDGQIVSGANKRLNTSDYKVGNTISMPGNGIYLSPNKQYVLDYYSELAEDEVLITFEFNSQYIITGNIEDKEAELSLSQVKIINIEKI